jgi:hypothetical protein
MKEKEKEAMMILNKGMTKANRQMMSGGVFSFNSYHDWSSVSIFMLLFF